MSGLLKFVTYVNCQGKKQLSYLYLIHKFKARVYITIFKIHQLAV